MVISARVSAGTIKSVRRLSLLGRYIWCAAITGFLAGGCDLQEPYPKQIDGSVIVVLTFDDGPLAAGLPIPELEDDPDQLLVPLRRILDVLQNRSLRSVFYITGPGSADVPQTLKGLYTDGILEIRQAGHVLGYHGFDHSLSVWAFPLESSSPAEERMHQDLDRLEDFLDQVLAPVGLRQADVFKPLFRQPYGGCVFNFPEGRRVAEERGLTYHGMRIDSGDWIYSNDLKPFAGYAVPTLTEEQHVQYCIDRIGIAVSRNAHRNVVDVLLHVNEFTSRHLDEFVDALIDAFEQSSGKTVVFDVPDCYLDFDDPTVDAAVVLDLLDGLAEF